LFPYTFTDGTHTTNFYYATGNTTGQPDSTSDENGNQTFYKYTDGTGGTPAGLVEDIIDAQGHDTHYDYAGMVITQVTTPTVHLMRRPRSTFMTTEKT
jgi:hypothetical protein